MVRVGWLVKSTETPLLDQAPRELQCRNVKERFRKSGRLTFDLINKKV